MNGKVNMYIKKFEELTIDDVGLVGGKNASLGQMIQNLSAQGVQIPTGFAITAEAYWHYLEHNKLVGRMKEIMAQLKDPQDIATLQKVGSAIRSLIASATMPDDLAQEIVSAYKDLSKRYKQDNCDSAVRSSATAEDLPTASFAGQQETFLNVRGPEQLLEACKKCMASLFTNRAIIYRIEQGFDHFKVALSVGVQKMVRSDLASSGVAFSLDTESGFKDVVMIESSYGLGESIVKGLVTPDEFLVHKLTLEQGFAPIIKKKLGDKKTKIVYADSEVKQDDVSLEDQQYFSLTDDEILKLARDVLIIEKHYSQREGRWFPMDIEWAKDGLDGTIYIIQARPETIHGVKRVTMLTTYALRDGDSEKHADALIVTGHSIGQHITSGIARVIKSVADIEQVQKGDIIVTEMTDPDWVPAMKRSAGIITDRGGRTCHAAIVSRELNILAIVGAYGATEKIKNGQEITIDCSRGNLGFVYEGIIPFDKQEFTLDTIPHVPTDVMVNLADPDSAFFFSFLPVKGVGLARIEFIISNVIKVHPMALLHPEKITDAKVKKEIDQLTAAYESKSHFFIDNLACGIAHIAAAFYPRPVIVRLSDFKSNEYRNLIGGVYFEPVEENPMLGFRGASRYYHENYQEAFALECAALQKVRREMGLKNVKVMVPFVRTVHEAQGVFNEMKRNGFERGKDSLEVIMMCEIPSNVILIDEFSKYFDGFSIGSNDLTQLILGVDRDSALLAPLFDERDPAVKKMLEQAVKGAQRNKRSIGICGQAPSDYPEIAEFLMKLNIDSMSLNPDAVLPFLMRQRD
ncbi:MAG: phosphoenolpyruvate synthase [bacterium]|nr:phosphoenolpyruvate synthase [bacterium]